MSSRSEIVEQNVHVLAQGRELLDGLSDELYAEREAAVSEGGVGAHFRHCIDFYYAFLEGVGGGRIDYDLRERSSRIEGERRQAAAELERLGRALEALRPDAEDDAVKVRAERPVTGAASARWTGSTLGRELRFLVSHTLHHYALIAAILRLRGEPVPAGFGVALSTLRHWNEV